MEHAVYRVFQDQNGRRMGSLVDMFASREDAEACVRRLNGEHDIVPLWTREIQEEDEHLWGTVAFDGHGGAEPVGLFQPGM